jgi:hypothetical protein
VPEESKSRPMGTDGSFENCGGPMPPDEICELPALAGLEHDRGTGEGREREQGAEGLGLQKLHEMTPLNHPRGLEVTNPSQICEVTGWPSPGV